MKGSHQLSTASELGKFHGEGPSAAPAGYSSAPTLKVIEHKVWLAASRLPPILGPTWVLDKFDVQERFWRVQLSYGSLFTLAFAKGRCFTFEEDGLTI